MHAFDPSPLKAETRGSLGSRATWSTELQVSQSYTENLCLEKQKEKEREKKKKRRSRRKGG